MKTIIIFFAFAVIVSMGGCKKKSTNEPINNSTPTPSNNPSIVEGTFYTIISMQKGSTSVNYTAIAGFKEPSVSNSYIDGDSVCLNGTWLHNMTATTFYKYNSWLLPSNNTTCPVNFGKVYNWTLRGNTKVPATNFIANTGSPYLDDSYINISSISKSLGVTISHPALNCTKVNYTISQSNGSPGPTITKTQNGSSTGVTFSSSELNIFSVGNVGVKIETYNIEITSPNSATSFTFTNQTDLTSGLIPITN